MSCFVFKNKERTNNNKRGEETEIKDTSESFVKVDFYRFEFQTPPAVIFAQLCCGD